ncbi:MAG: 16S rRNA processing protein RimM [Prevotella sp.]|nr:16S rRNA processing protein RimM [Prevotella sp.]
MIKPEDVYKIGRIGKPHGVKGETTLQFSDDVFDRTEAEYLFLEIEGILVPFFIEEYRFRNDSLALIKFCDIDTEKQARELTGCNVFFPRSLADDDSNTPSWAQIVGFRLIDIHINKVVGTVQRVDDSTINILFEVHTEDGKDVLIPASEDLITDIDTEKQEIRIELPDGILDLD